MRTPKEPDADKDTLLAFAKDVAALDTYDDFLDRYTQTKETSWHGSAILDSVIVKARKMIYERP